MENIYNNVVNKAVELAMFGSCRTATGLDGPRRTVNGAGPAYRTRIARAEHVSAASTRPRGARRRQTLRDTVTLDMWSCSLLEYHIYHVGKLPLCVPVRFDRV